MATSPSDQNNRNIIAWLDRLQASVRSSGMGGGENAFKLDSRLKAEDDSDLESDERNDDYDGAEEDREAEKMQSLPDAAVPLGLIANLALSNPKAKASSNNGDIASTDTLDDDNIVSTIHTIPSSTAYRNPFPRVLRTRLISCPDQQMTLVFAPC